MNKSKSVAYFESLGLILQEVNLPQGKWAASFPGGYDYVYYLSSLDDVWRMAKSSMRDHFHRAKIVDAAVSIIKGRDEPQSRHVEAWLRGQTGEQPSVIRAMFFDHEMLNSSLPKHWRSEYLKLMTPLGAANYWIVPRLAQRAVRQLDESELVSVSPHKGRLHKKNESPEFLEKKVGQGTTMRRP